MSSQIRILKHLKEKGIAFELLQSGLDHSGKSELNSIVFKWKKKFIGQKTAPYLDKYLWHIFSFEAVQCLMGESAKKELLRQYAADTFIFNERQQFLIRCIATIPILELDNFNDDIYISHYNMKWTYVITHEEPDIGPFFSTGNLSAAR